MSDAERPIKEFRAGSVVAKHLELERSMSAVIMALLDTPRRPPEKSARSGGIHTSRYQNI